MLDWERWTLTQSSGDAGVPVLVLALLLALVTTFASAVPAVVPVAVPVVAGVPDGDADGDGDCQAYREGDGEVVFSGLPLTLAGGDTVGE